MLAQEHGLRAWELLVTYIFRVAGAVYPTDLREVLPLEGHPEIEELMMTVADKLKAEGRAEGLRDALSKVLAARFGEVPASILARVQSSDLDTLEGGLDRALVARTLDEVFA